MLKTSLAAGAAIALLIGTPALGADLKSEIVNAQTHAGLAAAATSLDGVHTHLHHTLNCLVGPNGAGFDAKQMNPCANSGNGAIPDTTNAMQRSSLQMAAAKAQSAIAENNLAVAQKDANDIATMLKMAE